MEISELKRRKGMEHELAQLKRIVVDLILQNRLLKDVIEKSSIDGVWISCLVHSGPATCSGRSI